MDEDDDQTDPDLSLPLLIANDIMWSSNDDITNKMNNCNNNNNINSNSKNNNSNSCLAQLLKTNSRCNNSNIKMEDEMTNVKNNYYNEKSKKYI